MIFAESGIFLHLKPNAPQWVDYKTFYSCDDNDFGDEISLNNYSDGETV